MAKNNIPFIADLSALKQMGIDPETGLPLKLVDGGCGGDFETIVEMDVQECVNSGTWYNLPDDLNGELIERILYFRGEGIFFYMADKFYFLPFGVTDGIDCYGRYLGCIPLSFGGTISVDNDKKILGDTVKKPIYGLPTYYSIEEIEDAIKNGCVIISNRSRKTDFHAPNEYGLTKDTMTKMAECYPLARTMLFANSGIASVRVGSQDEASGVAMLNETIKACALTGKFLMPVIGSTDFQNFTEGSALKAEDVLMVMQSLNNYRQHIHGIGDGAIFEKKERVLQAEFGLNQSNTNLILDDKIRCRQEACRQIQAIWGLPIWYEPSDLLTGRDSNMDGDFTSDAAEMAGEVGSGAQEVSNE